MIKIDEYFEKYPENIIGFRVNKNTKIIDVWLNSTWEIPKGPSDIEIKKQKTSEVNNSTYFIIFSDAHDFGYIYDYVTNIIEHNLDIERKQILFKDKLSELKNLFTSLPYDELKAIKFESPYSLKNQGVDDDNEIDLENDITEEEKVSETQAEKNN